MSEVVKGSFVKWKALPKSVCRRGKVLGQDDGVSWIKWAPEPDIDDGHYSTVKTSELELWNDD